MTVDFFRSEPNARTSWRLAVLMGANARTYKFAFGAALLEYAAQDRAEVTLNELAVPYAMGLVAHLAEAPQAPSGPPTGESDFLAVAEREAEASTALGRPTDRLLRSAVQSMPRMVMRKFHNLRGDTPDGAPVLRTDRQWHSGSSQGQWPHFLRQVQAACG
ncbi:hypothetical protein ACFQ10_20560 [Streptomyces indonesiensis]